MDFHSVSDWEDVKTFGAVAEAGTIRKAADQLGVHYSTVGRRIERLEESLSVKLFDRRPEGLSITASGEQLLYVIREFGQSLLDVERHISGKDDKLSGRVAITMLDSIAEIAFAPRLQEFSKKFPELQIDFLTTMDVLDVARREADIAIRMDNNPPDSLVGKKLFSAYQTIYASPSYLSDLAVGQEEPRWISWGDDEIFRQMIRKSPWPNAPVWGSFSEMGAQHAAVQNGMGLALLPCFTGDRDEKLVRATEKAPTKVRDVWVLTHNDLRKTARIKAVKDFVEETLVMNQRAFEGN